MREESNARLFQCDRNIAVKAETSKYRGREHGIVSRCACFIVAVHRCYFGSPGAYPKDNYLALFSAPGIQSHFGFIGFHFSDGKLFFWSFSASRSYTNDYNPCHQECLSMYVNNYV